MNKQITAISWSHHHTPLEHRDNLSLSKKEIRKCITYGLNRCGIEEFVILVTCNRIEYYILTNKSANPLRNIKILYSNILKRKITLEKLSPNIYSNIEAVQHLSRVAAGMDSMIIGELQILSQVKKAHQTLLLTQPSASLLNQLFIDTINCAKLIRRNFSVSIGPTSVSELAVILISEIFNDMKYKQVLIIGAGESAKLTACALKNRGINKIIISNRNEQRARILAESISVSYAKLKDIHQLISNSDVVITATNSTEYLIKQKQIELIMKKRLAKLLLIDISTPRNIEPSIMNIGKIYYYDLDQMYAISSKRIRKNKELFKRAECFIESYRYKVMDLLQDSEETIDCYEA